MFASVDMPTARFLRCYLITANGETPLKVPKSLQLLTEEVRFIPMPERMSHLASKLAQTIDGVDFHGVRVEVWRYGFDAQNRQLRASKIVEVTVEKE